MAAHKAAAAAAERKIILIGAENIGAFSPLLGDAFQPGRIGLGCLVGEEVAGAAVFSVTDGLCTMDSILVREKYRMQGIGRLLFTEAAQTFKESGVTHFMANFGRIDGMTEFLRSIGFTVVTSGHVCLVDLKTLADAALVRRVLREAAETRRVLPYSKLNMNQKKELQIKARAFGFSPELWHIWNSDDDKKTAGFYLCGVNSAAKDWGQELPDSEKKSLLSKIETALTDI